jgi:guanylate kinase
VKPFPLVLSSPSGGGKTTIMRSLLAAREDLGYSISATTRPARPDEQDGRDYFFLTREEFEHRVVAKEFVEWAEYGGQLYGTLCSQLDAVMASGRHVVLDIEIHGAAEVKRLHADAVLVFIMPPSAEELLRRLGGTTGTRAANLDARLERAVVELHEALRYDYVVINTDRTAAVGEVAAILDAEERRPSRNPELVEQLAQLGREITAMRGQIKKQLGG